MKKASFPIELSEGNVYERDLPYENMALEEKFNFIKRNY